MKGLSALRYPVVAAGCLLLHNAVVIGANAVGARTAVAVLLSFAVIVVIGYLLHSAFTFREPASWTRFGKYATAMGANIPLAFLTLWLIHDWLGFGMAWASPLSSGVLVLTNYLLSRWAIYTSPSDLAL